MARISDGAIDNLEYLVILAMGAAGFVVTIALPQEGSLMWWLALAGFVTLCVLGMLVHGEQGRRTAAAKAALERRLAELSDGQHETRVEVHETRMVVLDIQRRLGTPVPASIVVALAGVEAIGEVGEIATLQTKIAASDRGVGMEEAKVEKPKEAEKILLAAPLLDDEKAATLREMLSRVSGKVGFMAVESTVEEMKSLAKVFRESEWDVVGMQVVRFPEPIVDIIVEAASEDTAYAGFVQDAMKAVGIDTMGAVLPSLPKDQIQIVVGNFTAKPAKPSASHR